MYLLVADDLTGGSDAGIQFAKRGMAAQLLLSADSGVPPCSPAEKTSLLVCNTNSRNLSGTDAAKSVSGIIAPLLRQYSRPGMVFKKIDSTLRGNLGAEMDALMDGFGFTTAFLAPSYPQQGRTVISGTLLVNGVPVHETGFANDPLTPIRDSSVTAIVQGQTRRRTGFIPLATFEAGADVLARHLRSLLRDGAECIIFDAETTGHLTAIATLGMAMDERPLFLGSAGLAEALADCMTVSMPETAYAVAPAERVLFVCGSAHQTSHAQTAELAAAGVPVIRMPGTRPEDAARARTAEELARALATGSACLAAPLARIGEPGNIAEGMALTASIANAAMDVLRRLKDPARDTALIVTGGETAYAVLRQLGTTLALHEELLPGIALSSVAGGEWDGLRVVTKAGGFGTGKTFIELLHMLRQRVAA